jgi:thiol-disulfide isomerase/thioredoxin
MKHLTQKWILGLTSSLLFLGMAQAQLVSGKAPEIVAGGQWFNSSGVKLADLKGKVVIVNMWVYSCINCHNSLPTLKGWYEKYKAQGLEIVGVHYPEFESDKIAANIKADLPKNGVTWPVVQDNSGTNWNNYQTRYWPSFFLIDRKGNIREYHGGEISSRFPEAIPGLEATLQKLLAEK